jgi:hypothetical protein
VIRAEATKITAELGEKAKADQKRIDADANLKA